MDAVNCVPARGVRTFLVVYDLLLDFGIKIMRLIVSILTLSFYGVAQAAVVGFEDFAPTGDIINVSETNPYIEAGFSIATFNSASAVVDSAALDEVVMPGNDSDWFAFEEGNLITISRSDGPGTFNFLSVLVGPSSYGGGAIDVSFTATTSNGGILTMDVFNLTSATNVAIGWSDLISVEFDVTDDAGIDNLNLQSTAVPIPAAVWLYMASFCSLFVFKKSA